MTQREENKQKLSKSILEMKFMKRSKIRIDEEKEKEEGQAMFADITTDDMKRESKFIIEPSFVPCERLIVGRLSFRGMNTEIERQMVVEVAAEIEKDETIKEKEVSDREMAEAYALTNTMGKKFNTKREFRMKNRDSKQENLELKLKNAKFLKPEVDDSKGNADQSRNVEPRTKKLKFLKPKD